MPPIWTFPFMLLASEKNSDRRTKLSRKLVPLSFGLPPALQVPVSSIAAVQDVRTSEKREQEVALNTVKAVSTAAVKSADSGEPLIDADINKMNMPILAEVVRNQPDMLKHINGVAQEADKRAGIKAQVKTERVASELFTAIDQAIIDPGNKLSDAELDKLPHLKEFVSTLPALKQNIEALALRADRIHLTGEVIQAINSAQQAADNKLPAEELAKLPRLKALIDSGNAPALSDTINTVAQQAQLMEGIVKSMEALSNKYLTAIAKSGKDTRPQKLTVEELKTASPLFNKLLSNSDWRGRIVEDGVLKLPA